MKDWIAYCVSHGLDFIDLKRWAHDSENRLAIDSNIPIGYGLGSSGAVTACIYDRYVEKSTDQIDTNTPCANGKFLSWKKLRY